MKIARIPMPFLLVCLVAGAATLSVPVSARAAGEESGVNVSGTADYLYQPCVTFACTPAPGNWSQGSDGGLGHNLAFVAYPGSLSPDLGYLASAQLLEALALPQLGVYAAATTQEGTHPGYSSTCCYLNSASASSQAVQYYTYTGTSPQVYTLAFDLEGTATGLRGSVSAGVTLHDGAAGTLEQRLGNTLDGAFVSFSLGSGSGPFTRTGSVSTTLDPGEGFYVSAFLTAFVPREGEAFLDASNTLAMHFTAGDVALLTPTLAPVPEPATAWCLGLGVFGLALWARRRPSRLTT